MDSLIVKTNALHCEDLDDLEPDDLNASKEYALTLLAKIISSRKLNTKAVQSILQKAWSPTRGMKFHSQQDNIFRITLNHEWDRDRILKARPWSVMSSHVVVRDWPPHLAMDEIDFSQSPFWIRISGLPPNLMTKSNAEKIGSKIGKVLEVDFTADGKIAWLRFMRIQVMMNINQPLLTGFPRKKDSKMTWTRLQYERLPDFCFICGRLGHTNRGCPHPPLELPANMSTPFGPWLRAEYSDRCPLTASWNPPVNGAWQGSFNRLPDIDGVSISDHSREKSPHTPDGIPEKEKASSSLPPTIGTTTQKPINGFLQPPISEDEHREPSLPLPFFPLFKTLPTKETSPTASNHNTEPDDNQTNQIETNHTDSPTGKKTLHKRKSNFDQPPNTKKVEVAHSPQNHSHPLPCPSQIPACPLLTVEIAVNKPPSIKGGHGTPPLTTTIFMLEPGESASLLIPPSWSGQFWARTLCSYGLTGRFNCLTGDCGTGSEECVSAQTVPPVTVAKFDISGDGGVNFYGVSAARGYNLAILVVPQGDVERNCMATACVNSPDGPSETAGSCTVTCFAFGDPANCCIGADAPADTCEPSYYSFYFGSRCPRAYRCVDDDGKEKNRTFACSLADYHITFCPHPSPATGDKVAAGGGTQPSAAWKTKRLLNRLSIEPKAKRP
ncbi:hypothetical protein RJ640_004190 [Escallonia rubra]|uniref:CCHC-type domain-containing protein n=1 Tax=Escallonia rubra TaxID=112253 RepID=A0AA88RT70_9ASTE|nr:hypothetical protein RJ640_004190 [Escallonia rubra]